MIRATVSIPEPNPPALLGDLRLLLSLAPELEDHPRRLAACLEADEQSVREVLEDRRYLDEVLA